MSVAIVHDHLVQRGGAERLLLSIADAFPDAPIHTSFYGPERTHDSFAGRDVRPLPIDRLRFLRAHHRAVLPLLAPSFSRLHLDEDLVVCSSSGWAHGVSAAHAKLVYFHAPARWLYSSEEFFATASAKTRIAGAALRPLLLRWDRRAVRSIDRFVANSTETRDRLRRAYGIEADIVMPPTMIDPSAARRPVAGIEPGYVLCVARFVAYKNVDAVVSAFATRRDDRLVVVGSGPEEDRLRAIAPTNVTFVGVVGDTELRWLYANARAVVSAAFEDFGLTLLEAASFGRPVAALRWGGHLDSVVEGATGIFFERPEARLVDAALDVVDATRWDENVIIAQARRFGVDAFVRRLRDIASELVPREALGTEPLAHEVVRLPSALDPTIAPLVRGPS